MAHSFFCVNCSSEVDMSLLHDGQIYQYLQLRCTQVAWNFSFPFWVSVWCFKFYFRCGLVGISFSLILIQLPSYEPLSPSIYCVSVDVQSYLVAYRQQAFQRSLPRPLAFPWITAARTNPSRDCRPMSRGLRHTRPSWLSSQGVLARSRYG